jgi:hypothetical protein
MEKHNTSNKEESNERNSVVLSEEGRGYLVTYPRSYNSTLRKVKFIHSPLSIGNPPIYPIYKKEYDELTLIDYVTDINKADKRAYEKALGFAKDRSNILELKLIFIK